MSEEPSEKLSALEAENAQLKIELAGRKKTAARALSSYQQRALQMEVIRQQNEELDRLAGELMVAKQNLEGRAREIEEAARLKSEFLANFSHEIRTPLNGIIGYCDLVIREEGSRLTPHGRRDLNVVKGNAKTLLALINDILDLSKIEAGRVDVVKERTDLEELADECSLTVREYLKGKPVELTFKIDEAVRWVHTDGLKLRQVLLNLLSNAAKFTENGEIVLEANPSGRDVVITVEDTGVGIPSEQLHLVFEKFRQVDGSSTRTIGGTGLGLAIVRELTRVLGGNVTVKSVVGRGTTFTVVFSDMLDAAAEGEAAQPGADTPVEQATEQVRELVGPGRGGLILVVDDEPLVQRLISGQLENEGFEVRIAEDGVQALRIAREAKPQAIVLDIHIPRIDGWKVLSQLKSDPALAHIPVVVVSVEEKRSQGFSLGACEYLVKPVEPERLVNVVRQALGKGSGSAGGSGEILVVDDDASTRELVSRNLRHAGWSTTEARNGEEALLRARFATPALVVLDLMMPNLDGFQVLQRLRSQNVNVPVVVLTGKTLTEDEQKILRDGLATYVKKGGDALENVVAQARELLVSERQRQAARQPRVLYVEDSAQNRDIVRRYLGGDFEILEAEDGEYGVEKAIKELPDLILMDLSLPRIDGWEASRRIRALPALANIPIIAVTAHAGREYRDKAFEAGCNAYITKPLERDSLFDVIRQHLPRRLHA